MRRSLFAAAAALAVACAPSAADALDAYWTTHIYDDDPDIRPSTVCAMWLEDPGMTVAAAVAMTAEDFTPGVDVSVSRADEFLADRC